MLGFQQVISKLQDFWGENGCAILPGYDLEVGAGTFNPATLMRALENKFWRATYVQPSRRPCDGRYGENPNRVHKHHQFQVVMTPSPDNIQDMYLDSLRCIGIDTSLHDIRFVEDDWESPTLGAAGLGWEVWCDGMEITQFTYFQQVGGISCCPVLVELTYGLERLTMFLQNVDNIYDINWNGKSELDKITYKDVHYRQEVEFSKYCFEAANVEFLERHFLDAEKECSNLIEHGLSLPAYEQCVKASHIFNLLDSRGAISVTERANRISRIRALAKKCCEEYAQARN